MLLIIIETPGPAKLRLKLLMDSVKKEELTAANVSIPWPLEKNYKKGTPEPEVEDDPCLRNTTAWIVRSYRRPGREED